MRVGTSFTQRGLPKRLRSTQSTNAVTSGSIGQAAQAVVPQQCRAGAVPDGTGRAGRRRLGLHEGARLLSLAILELYCLVSGRQSTAADASHLLRKAVPAHRDEV